MLNVIGTIDKPTKGHLTIGGKRIEENNTFNFILHRYWLTYYGLGLGNVALKEHVPTTKK